jgi:hypothetical protein
MREDFLTRVCRLPIEYRERATVPWVDLVREATGGAAPSASELATSFVRQPELVEAWLTYSADQRVSSAWYFSSAAGGGFTTGYYPTGPAYNFASAAEACALFVHKVLCSTLAL